MKPTPADRWIYSQEDMAIYRAEDPQGSDPIAEAVTEENAKKIIEAYNASLRSPDDGLVEALEQISAGTYSSFPLEYKELCKAMMNIAKEALERYRGKS